MEQTNTPTIEASWLEALKHFFETPAWHDIATKARAAYQSGTPVYPPPHDVFRSFELCPFHAVRVVILGQDPYHGPRQAHGLSFSVTSGIAIPPSLQNIYKEIEHDIGTPAQRTSGDLTLWAQQGVFLLNSVLTVFANQPASHRSIGWETFTDQVIAALSGERSNIVFLLWGSFAKSKASYIDTAKHLVLTAAHPSPFSAHNGFFGCGHFSKANEYLEQHGLAPIVW